MTKTARVVERSVQSDRQSQGDPGATVEYCITIKPMPVRALPPASPWPTLLPANTTYVPNSLTVGGLGVGGACVLNGTIEDDNATSADETDLYGGSFDGTTVHAVRQRIADRAVDRRVPRGPQLTDRAFLRHAPPACRGGSCSWHPSASPAARRAVVMLVILTLAFFRGGGAGADDQQHRIAHAQRERR